MAKNKWLLPYRNNSKNYEDIGCLPYALEHDRGFSGRKLYRVVKRLPDGDFLYVQCGHYDREKRGSVVAAVKLAAQPK